MVEYAEMFALVFKGNIMGYRIYITVDGNTECYDFQTENTNLSMWVEGRTPLQRVGDLLMTKDEVNKEVRPKQLSKQDLPLVTELLGQVQYFYKLKTESRR